MPSLLYLYRCIPIWFPGSNTCCFQGCTRISRPAFAGSLRTRIVLLYSTIHLSHSLLQQSLFIYVKILFILDGRLRTSNLTSYNIGVFMVGKDDAFLFIDLNYSNANPLGVESNDARCSSNLLSNHCATFGDYEYASDV